MSGPPCWVYVASTLAETRNMGLLRVMTHLRRCGLQELVQKKLELAELTEDYEQVCHAFLKADTRKYGPTLAKLRQSGSVATIPGSVSVHVTTQ